MQVQVLPGEPCSRNRKAVSLHGYARRETSEESFYCRASRRFKDEHVHYVYVLLCGDGHLYTGYSSNLRERVRQHERGEVFSTKSRRPVRLVFYEAFAIARRLKDE